MNTSGEVYNDTLFKQNTLFKGLKWGEITPTDIDGTIDFGNKAWVIFELKHTGNDLPPGQRWAFERMVDNLNKIKPAICFIAEHSTRPEDDIIASEAIVVEYRYKEKKWMKTPNGNNLKESINIFLKIIGLEEIYPNSN